MKLFWEKYKPRNLKELVGQENAKIALLDFVRNFKTYSKKAALLFGPSGVGKTAAVHALAEQLNFELIELNPSDFKDKEKIKKVFRASQQESLFFKGKLLLIDELEGFEGIFSELFRLIDFTKWPILLTASSFLQKLRPIKNKLLLIEFKPLESKQLVSLLKKVCEKEKIKIEPKVLEVLAAKAQGDARAALNDLQVLSALKKTIDLDFLFTRKKSTPVSSALNLIFSAKTGTLTAFDDTDLSMDEAFLWLDENLPRAYKGKELKQAYEVLAKADLFRARIKRQQHWRFLSYIMTLLTEGIASVKNNSRKVNANWKAPSRFLIQKQKRDEALASKLAPYMHLSKARAFQQLGCLKLANVIT